MAGNIDAALREAEAAIRVFEAEKQTGRAAAAVLLVAETAWQARRIDEARRWAERGIEAARASGDAEHLARLLSLAATLANLRGEYAKAAAYQAEIEKLDAEGSGRRGGDPARAARSSSPSPTRSRRPSRASTRPTRSRRCWPTSSSGSSRRTRRATSAPALCEKWTFEEDGLAVRLHLRSGRRLLGRRAADRGRRQGLARALDPALAGPDACGLRRDPRRRRVRRREAPRASTASPRRPDREIVIRLADPLPIFPSLLTDPRTAIVAAPASGGGRRSAPGPSGSPLQTPDRVVLERNPRYAKEPARVDRIEFRTSLAASAIADGLRAGSLDIARDLLPQDLEAILREPRFRAGLVETPKKNTYFARLSPGSAGRIERGRSGPRSPASVRTQDLVWGTLGRFALPATGLIPPGILGHDAGTPPDCTSRARRPSR